MDNIDKQLIQLLDEIEKPQKCGVIISPQIYQGTNEEDGLVFDKK